MTKYHRYQDYVIKDGRLIGEFDEMYQDFNDPWDQSTREIYALEKMIGLELLEKHGNKKPLEYGCGLGQYTQKLYEKFGCAGGIDISTTAIRKARQSFSGPSFYATDLLDQDVLRSFKPDCICMIEITWYILEQLEKFKRLLLETSSGCGFFHSLMTYAPGQQKYGVEYFTNLEEIKEYWSDIIAISDWGQIGNVEYGGGYRTFFYGKIK